MKWGAARMPSSTASTYFALLRGVSGEGGSEGVKIGRPTPLSVGEHRDGAGVQPPAQRTAHGNVATQVNAHALVELGGKSLACLCGIGTPTARSARATNRAEATKAPLRRWRA